MIKRKVKFWMRLTGLMALSATVIFGFGQGCSDSFQSASSSSLSGSGDICSGGNNKVIDKNFESIPGQRTVSIAYGQQLLDSFVSCTGIERPSARTLEEWGKRNQSLSEYGLLTDVSGALMMSVAAVAAEVCRDLLNKEMEAAQESRAIFGGVNFASASMSSVAIEQSADLLALSCWQRRPSSAEKSEIVNSITQMNVNSELGALSVCTGMLSSLAAIEQ